MGDPGLWLLVDVVFVAGLFLYAYDYWLTHFRYRKSLD